MGREGGGGSRERERERERDGVGGWETDREREGGWEGGRERKKYKGLLDICEHSFCHVEDATFPWSWGKFRE